MQRKHNYSFHVLLLTLLLSLLGGCEGLPVKGGDSGAQDATTQDEAERQLQLAKNTLPPEQANHRLKALDIYIARGDYANAQKVVESINSTTLTLPQMEQYIILGATLALEQNRTDQALSYFNAAPSDAFASRPVDIQLRANELHAKALMATGSSLDAAQLLIYASGLYTGEEYWRVLDDVWNALRATPSLELSRALETAQDYDWRGWLELITAVRQNQFSLEMQLAALKSWRRQWADHPAARRLPAELKMLAELPNERPSKIALLAPLSGNLAKAGEAIRDGFLAAYYQDINSSESNGQGPEIQIIDSGSIENIADLYLSLQLEGYDLIIGPLEKEAVAQLAGFPELDPPVLALNYLDEGVAPPPGMYQYGLAAEDEVRQIARKLISEGKRGVAVIYPDAPWAIKLASVLDREYQAANLPLPIPYKYVDGENYSDGIAHLLQINASKQRARKLKSVAGKFEYEPRRRQDIDGIIMISTPYVARQLKPLLLFHYASDLPVYATSQIYGGVPQPDKDHDLNGIHFTETPWLLSQSLPLKQDIRYVADTTRYERLYAMGADAYTIAPRLSLMRQFPDSQIQGTTGNLFMNESQQIRRILEWAIFERGLAKAELNSPESPPQ
ncbi:putative lipoprotein [Hahella chejuensis KCTC 2396]|uniref:Putative lipoprotein n=1 Tax=Hahella chejuensis (strain KCTC 2396) TaxID=349521 RepID=Q2S9Y1_HAHCH|nr:penicillin-binding protein activator [Hahella chejuensis]ABC32543.1 putative lipoprotein [Hahella chejuensis KCTC 2396]